MNHVERFRAVMDFAPVDRLPRVEWATYWNLTIDRWKAEGLPAELAGHFDIAAYFGLDPYWQAWYRAAGPGYPRPEYHGHGHVATMDDYNRLREHLYPPMDWVDNHIGPWLEKQRASEAVVWITLEGFFWFPRTLFGIEPHLYAFYDQPELMHRINADLADWSVSLLRRIAKLGSPAFMTFAEDMSYNHGPMLSEALFDEFCAPYYRQVVPVLEEMGTLPIVDSDGDVTAMLPWLDRVGVKGILPLERQAGVDGARLRQVVPRFRLFGHFDKMVMHRGEAAIRSEFERLLPTMRQGGFVPSVDHQTPPGVSLEQYRTYLRLLWEYTERAAGA